jgi:Protein of unknown function (P_fal_TIGR01639).
MLQLKITVYTLFNFNFSQITKRISRQILKIIIYKLDKETNFTNLRQIWSSIRKEISKTKVLKFLIIFPQKFKI